MDGVFVAARTRSPRRDVPALSLCHTGLRGAATFLRLPWQARHLPLSSLSARQCLFAQRVLPAAAFVALWVDAHFSLVVFFM